MLDAFVTNHFSQVVAVRYHAWWPGSSDPMYQANVNDNRARINYLGINAVPCLWIDGCVPGGFPFNMDGPLQTRLAVGSPVGLTIAETRVGSDSIVADITANIVSPLPGNQCRLRVFAVERHISYATPPGANGQKDFYDVYRAAFPDVNGLAMPTTTGQHKFQVRYKRDANWADAQIYTVAFVQNDATKEVLNSVKARTTPGSGPLSKTSLAATAPARSACMRDDICEALGNRIDGGTSFAVEGVTGGFYGVETFEQSTIPIGWSTAKPASSAMFIPGVVPNGPSFGGFYSIRVPFYDVPSGKDTLYSPTYMVSSNSDSLTFDLAYAKYPGANDRLVIRASNNGGHSYSFLICQLDTATMATVPGTMTTGFVPASSSQWKRFSFPLGLLTSVENPVEIPNSFALEQNWPNPFNPFTIIKYTVGVAGPSTPSQEALGRSGSRPDGREGWGLGARKTSLVVYDVLGREVATLVNEVKAPGTYEVRFDGSRLASGVYVYRLSAGSFVQTRKMLLIR